MYFTITVWSAYHRLAIDVSLGRRYISVWWIDQVIIYPVVEYLELPVKGEVATHAKKEKDQMNLFELQMVGIELEDKETVRMRVRKARRLSKDKIRGLGLGRELGVGGVEEKKMD